MGQMKQALIRKKWQKDSSMEEKPGKRQKESTRAAGKGKTGEAEGKGAVEADDTSTIKMTGKINPDP